MKIAIDIDSTVYDIHSAVRPILLEMGYSYELSDVTTWDFFGTTIPFADFMSAIDQVTASDLFTLTEPCAPAAIQSLIDDGHEVFFLSAMRKARKQAMKARLERDGLGHIPLVIAERPKESYDWDLIIDDCPTIKRNCGRRILHYPQPYNNGIFGWSHLPTVVNARGFAISGKMRTGKDTLCLAMAEADPSVERIAHADALKALASTLTGLDCFNESVKKRHRAFLIDLGKALRTFNANHWVNECAVNTFNKMEAGALPVITDVRFKNEAEFWHNHGFKLIRLHAQPETILARGGTMLDDPSETDLDDWDEWDAVFHTDRSTPDHIATTLLGRIVI